MPYPCCRVSPEKMIDASGPLPKTSRNHQLKTVFWSIDPALIDTCPETRVNVRDRVIHDRNAISDAASAFSPHADPTLASIPVLAYRPPHAIEIEHMGGGLLAALPDRRRIRRGAPARRGGGGRGLCQGGAARWQRHALHPGPAGGLWRQ